MCHVFRCQLPARTIANALRDICKKILIERSLAQSSSKLTEKLISARDRDHPARARSARPTRFETRFLIYTWSWDACPQVVSVDDYKH